MRCIKCNEIFLDNVTTCPSCGGELTDSSSEVGIEADKIESVKKEKGNLFFRILLGVFVFVPILWFFGGLEKAICLLLFLVFSVIIWRLENQTITEKIIFSLLAAFTSFVSYIGLTQIGWSGFFAGLLRGVLISVGIIIGINIILVIAKICFKLFKYIFTGKS